MLLHKFRSMSDDQYPFFRKDVVRAEPLFERGAEGKILGAFFV